MNYGETLKQIWFAFLLKKPAMTKLAKEKNIFKFGMITLLLAGLLSFIGDLLTGYLDPTTGFVGFTPDFWFYFVFILLSTIILSLVWYSLYHLLAMWFGGKAKWSSYVGILANLSVFVWLAVIPYVGDFLSWIGSLWALVVNVFVLKRVHKLDTWKAIVVTLLGIAVMVLIFVIILWFTQPDVYMR